MLSKVLVVVVFSLMGVSCALFQAADERGSIDRPDTDTTPPSPTSEGTESDNGGNGGIPSPSEPSGDNATQMPMSSPQVPAGYSSEIVQVKFKAGTNLDNITELFPMDVRDSVTSIRPLFGLPPQELDRLNPDLRLWYRISLKPGTDAVAFVEQLNSIDEVDVAEFAPLPAPPPSSP